LNDPKNKDYQSALDAAIDLKVEPIVALAIKKHQEKDLASAIDLYQQAISLRPKNAGVWSNLAGALYAREDYQKAKDAYAKALEIDPKGQVGNYYLIALIDENFNNAAEAISNYQKYLASAATGAYAGPAKQRLTALNANPKDTIKIKSEAELAKLKQADDAYQAAIKLQGAKKWDEAIAQYQNAINLQPQEPAYAFAMGTLFQARSADTNNSSDLDLAMKWYQTALDQDPKNKQFKDALATAIQLKAGPIVDQAIKKQTAGDLAGAIELYQQALQVLPNDAGTWTNLASALQASDDFQGARDAFQKAIGIDPKGQIANWYYIAAIDETFGKAPQAIADYQKYLAGAPTGQFAGPAKDRVKVLTANPNATVKIATSSEVKVAKEASDAFDQAVKLQTAQKYDEAIAMYQKAIQAVPSEPAYVYAQATAYQGKGDFDSAIQGYTKASAMDPKNKQYKDLLAAAYELKAAPIMDEAIKKHGAGDLPGAIELYLKALAITPKNAHGWTNLAGAYQASEDFQRARDTYQKAFDLDPKGEADNTYFIAALDENFNQGAKALQEYQRYVSAAPRGSYVGLAQARIKALIANPNAVQKIVTMAEQKTAAAAGEAYNNAVKFQQENKLDEAIAEYDKAIAANPSEASYYYSKGTALQAKNDLDGAMAMYQKAANLNPKEKAYPQLIAQIKQAKAGPLLESAYQKQTTKDANGNYDLPGAIADYVAALRLSDDANTHFSLGTAYQANKEPQKALSEYNKALQMDPKLVNNHYWMATVYEELKQLPLAIASYKKYLLAAPKGEYAAEAQSRIKILAGGK
jgi:tetratricopeptide (TPR) repeat protein